jgi:hypothetical protein
METLYEKASLILNPGVYDTSKVYATKPFDGSGDLTFTRSNDTATRVGPDGLIEKVRTNLLTYSQAFDNAAYNKGTGGSVSANTVVAPDGTTTADAYTFASSTSTFAYLSQQASSTSTLPHTFSIYIKRPTGSGSRTLRLVVSDVTTTTGISSNFTITESWQRFEFTRTSGSSTGLVGIGFALASSGVSIAGGEVLDVWAAQLETGDIATDYIATTTAAVSVGPVANVPRLDYLGSSCPRLLLEPQRTNIALFSESFDNAIWTKGGSNSVTANAIISPDGTQNADFIVSTATNTAAKYVYQVIGSTATPTATIYAKAGAITEMMFYCQGGNGIYFNLTNGAFIDYYASGSSTITSYSSVAVGNGWYRYAMTFNTSITSIEAYMSVNTNISSSIADGDGFYLWGFQAEAASYATSYIPTLGSASTRGADACSKTGISSLIGQTSGSVFFEFTVNSVTQIGDPVLWYMKDGGSGQRYVELYSNSNLVYAEIDGGGLIAQITKTGLTVGRHKCAIAYAPNDMTFYVDGVQVGTDTSGTPNGFSTFGLQYYLSLYTGQQMVNQALLFKTRLSNADLAALTA